MASIDREGEGVNHFFAMGGYAVYVWTAFGVTIIVLLAFLLQSWYAARRSESALAEARQLARGAGPDAPPPSAVLRPAAAETAAPAHDH